MDLHVGDSRAHIDLDGGRLASLVASGHELLITEGPKATRWGSFPMVPWCGRMRDGLLHHDGASYGFPLTSPPHANHGFGHTQAWTQVDADTIRTELGAPWPFGGHVTQRFALAADRLVVSIEVHAGDVPMPAMAGWHPWFRRELGVGGPARLSFTGGRVYELGADGIPTGALIDAPPGPWDECFVDLDTDPVITWEGALRLTLSGAFDGRASRHWVIFTEPEHALCVEPQSGAPNDINRSPRLVVPGHPLTGEMVLRWEPA